MSWVKAVPAGGDDVFDEDEDEDDIKLQNKEWKYNMEKRVKDGYRDGIDAGKETSLQSGFNIGYKKGAEDMVAVGQLKGIVSAIQCWCQLQHRDSPRLASVTQLLQRVVLHEEALIERMKVAQTRPQASVGDIAERVEDLAVRQEDSGDGENGCERQNCCRGEGAKEENPVHMYPPSSMDESLEQLLISCMDLVGEFGLPEELLQHLQRLRSVEC